MRYKIPSNSHYSRPIIPKMHFFCETFSWQVNLYGSCIYKAEKHTAKAEQINKLPGFTYGLRRHNNEFRFGWRVKQGTSLIELFAYHYLEGSRPSLVVMERDYKICDIDVNTNYILTLHRFRDIIFYNVMNMDGECVGCHWIDCKVGNNIGWVLGFYAGGMETYEQDMYADIKRLK